MAENAQRLDNHVRNKILSQIPFTTALFTNFESQMHDRRKQVLTGALQPVLEKKDQALAHPNLRNKVIIFQGTAWKRIRWELFSA